MSRSEDLDRRRIGFIGAGRVANALARGFARAGYAVTAVASRSGAAARALAAAVPGCRAHDEPQSAANDGDLVFLTVPDDVIGGVARGIAWRGDQAVVHCSGATEIDVLAPAARAGAQIGGFHPLQTFTDPETALAGMSSCVVAIEAGDPLAAQLDRLAQALGARAMRLPPGARARYHGGGSFAATFVVTLLHEAVRIWRSFGMTEQEALAALLPLARGTLDSVAELGLAQGIAGPIPRGDAGTIAKHLEAFAALDATTLELYRALALRAIPVAIEKGTLTLERAEELRRLLTKND